MSEANAEGCMQDGHVMSGVEALVIIQYSEKWVHKKFSGIKDSMSKVMKLFICRGCLNLVTSIHCTNVLVQVQIQS